MDVRNKFESPEFEKFIEKYELNQIHTNVFERIITLVIAALGLVAALAWDEALHKVFDTFFKGEKTVLEEVLYALLITAIAALISVWLGKLLTKRNRKD